MAVRVTWQDESGIDQHYWIERNVFRIGNRQGADIVLADDAGQDAWVVVEYRGQKFVVHNSGQQQIMLAGDALEPNGKGVWNSGSSLALPGQPELHLEAEGDLRPAPAPKGDLVFTGRSGADATASAGSAATASGTGPPVPNPVIRDLVITALALCGFFFLMAQLLAPSDSRDNLVASQVQVRSIEQLRAVYDRERDHSVETEQLFSQIQLAFLQVVRSSHKRFDDPGARQELIRIRDRLSRKITQHELDEDSFEYQAHQYVLYVLQRIS